MGKNRLNKYNDEVKKDTKKDTKVPEGYKKVEMKPVEMPTYKNPDDKSVKMPVYKNPDDKSVKMPVYKKKYKIVPKDSSKIKEFNIGGQIKPIKAVLGVAVLGTKKGRDTLKKFFKGKKEIASSAPGMAAVPRTMNKGGGMDMGAKPRPRGNPGVVEIVVGKGGDYIKDLIN